MKWIYFVCLIFLPMQVFAETSSWIFLSPGQEHTLNLSSQADVKIQKSNVVRVQIQKKNLRIKALKLGQSSILLQNRFFEIAVISPDHLQFVKHLLASQDQFLGIKLSYANKKIKLEGTLYKTAEIIQISALQKKFQATFENHLTVVDEIADEIHRLVQNDLLTQKLPSENILFTKPWSVRIKEKSDLLRYRELLQSYGIIVSQDDSALEIKPLVQVEIAVAEVKKDFRRTLGVKWPASFTAEVLPDESRKYGNLAFQADALENQGFGRVLARPNILCRSGSEAEFLAGGEFPIKILNYKSQDVIWKKYGVLLKVKPQADQNGRISLQLNTEISSIDLSKAVDGIPGLFTNRVSSHFDLTRSQTIALSGMIKFENQKQNQGLPWLSQIPLLGTLFSSQDFIENKSEMIIFVRPRIVLKEDHL